MGLPDIFGLATDICVSFAVIAYSWAGHLLLAIFYFRCTLVINFVRNALYGEDITLYRHSYHTVDYDPFIKSQLASDNSTP